MSDRREAIMFDEESAERPHLDMQLVQERELAATLRKELEQVWKREDEWRELRRRCGV